nr:MoaD/ThiS family protein [uncultured Brevundimonas sp.]
MARVTLFGAFQDMAGWRTRELDAGTLGALREALSTEHSPLGERLEHASTLVILNGAVAPRGRHADDTPLSPDDEVGFGPPVSGG